MKVALVSLALLAAAAAANADSRTLDVVNATLGASGSELQLSFLDRAESPRDCDYYVSRFEYVTGVEPALLLVELASPEPCLVDRIGRRSGSLKWNLPPELRGSGKLTLVVGGQSMGELDVTGTDVRIVPRNP